MKETIGRVFDIRKFSVHDGTGIRTTVFMKGCNLRCLWCHNPEGFSLEKSVLYFENKCIHCAICVGLPSGCVTKKDGKLVFAEKCPDWHAYADACPTNAIVEDSLDMSVAELITIIKEDIPFYKYGGGGVTFSGGEPLIQVDFLEEVAKECHNQGISVGIETALDVPASTVEKIFPYLDIAYIDFKIFEETAHRDFIGADNKRIKENIKMLLESPHKEKITIRTPLILTMTAFPENIQKISAYISGYYPDVRYEMLNYNPLAKGKYSLVGMEYFFKENPKPLTEEKLDLLYACAKESGVKNLIHN